MTAAPDTGALLSLTDLACHFTARKGPFYDRRTEVVRALDGVSFDLDAGSSFGIVGESGSGKSTLARCIMRLDRATRGTIRYGDLDITTADERALFSVRREVQMVFQDPWASLNPRHTVKDILTEPWEIHRGIVARRDYPKKVAELLELVGLNSSFVHRYPSQFSGGQRQRVAIARALALSPRVLILDEAVSALDVSVQAQILNLLADLRARLGMTYLFISHDLSVVRHLCQRIGVMYLGRLVETGTTEEIFTAPRHPYTQALLSAMPDRPEEARIALEGEVPSPLNPPSGCHFRTRCGRATECCAATAPELRASEGGQAVACLHPLGPPP